MSAAFVTSSFATIPSEEQKQMQAELNPSDLEKGKEDLKKMVKDLYFSTWKARDEFQKVKSTVYADFKKLPSLPKNEIEKIMKEVREYLSMRDIGRPEDMDAYNANQAEYNRFVLFLDGEGQNNTKFEVCVEKEGLHHIQYQACIAKTDEGLLEFKPEENIEGLQEEER